MITLPKDDLEKKRILSSIARKFKKDKEYDEIEIVDLLKSCDVDDHALFRRELVNFNYLGRDAYKGIYWVKTYELSKGELEKIALRQSKIKEIS